ncbi:caspase family protein [Micromonospora sp. NPDC004704]
MTRRALLIGAQTFGLAGVEHDIAAMDEALSRRGMTVERCVGPDATRDGIVAAYERLIADTGPADAALVYYSGHGGYAWPLEGESTKVARNDRQFIVPTDFRAPTADDFRGITALELSVLLARLTERTSNATVILDCCHSGLMSRNLGAAHVRQMPGVVRADLDAHHERRIRAGLPVHLVDPTGNKNAVRLVACATDQFAHELPRSDGPGRYGLLTRSLIQALDEADGLRVSWSRLIIRVRHLVQLHVPHQRPDVEGPFERVLFETENDDSAGWLFVTDTGDGRASIAGAALLGVQTGDEFAIMPGSAAGPATEGRIAFVRVDDVGLTAATGRLVFDVPGTTLPADARAYRVTAVAPRVPVRVPSALVPAVENSAFVRVAGPGEDVPVRVVESPDGALVVHDGIGPLHEPRQPGPRTVARVRADLNRIARATVLRGIREESRSTFNPPVTLEWGHVRAGMLYPLPPAGATVHVGERVYFRIRNNARRQLYVSLIEIGMAYAVSVLNDLDPGGIRLPGGEEYVSGGDEWEDQPIGWKVDWPKNLDRGSPRPETVLMLITAEPQNVSPLHQEGVWATNRTATALTNLLAHFSGGADRDLTRPTLFCVRSLELTVDPAARQHER